MMSERIGAADLQGIGKRAPAVVSISHSSGGCRSRVWAPISLNLLSMWRDQQLETQKRLEPKGAPP
jgi:hypothetical protein